MKKVMVPFSKYLHRGVAFEIFGGCLRFLPCKIVYYTAKIDPYYDEKHTEKTFDRVSFKEKFRTADK